MTDDIQAPFVLIGELATAIARDLNNGFQMPSFEPRDTP